MFQLINTGTGTVEGFGEATLVMSATLRDRTVQPRGPELDELDDPDESSSQTACWCCGPHSLSTPRLPQVTGTWTVDGASSTGVFAGAWGSGDEAADIPNRSRLRCPVT